MARFHFSEPQKRGSARGARRRQLVKGPAKMRSELAEVLSLKTGEILSANDSTPLSADAHD